MDITKRKRKEANKENGLSRGDNAKKKENNRIP